MSANLFNLKIKNKNIFFSLIVMILTIMPLLLSIESQAVFASVCVLCFMVLVYFFLSVARDLGDGKHVATAIVLFGIILWYFYPASIYSLFMDPQQYKITLNSDFESSDVNKSLLLIGLFASSFIFFSGFDGKYKSIGEHRIYERSRNIPRLALIAAFLGALPILMSGFSIEAILEALLVGRSADKPWIHSANIGNQTSGLLYLVTCLSWAGVMFLITYTMHARDNFYKKTLCFVFTVLLFLFLSIDSGTRSLSMLALLPSICIYAIAKLKDRSLSKIIAPITMIVISIFFALQLQLLIRNGGVADYESFLKLLSADAFVFGGSIDYFIETLYSVLLVPAQHDYFLEFDLVYFATFPIPRFIWYDKPVTEIVWFYTMSRWGFDLYVDSGNIFPGLVGQYYMAWGYFGPVFIGGFFAYLSRILDRRIFVANRSNALFSLSVYLMYGIWLFVSFRYFSPGFLFPVLIAHLMLVMSRRKLKRVIREF
jgi:oligosaccharide repeat unit polymerase